MPAVPVDSIVALLSELVALPSRVEDDAAPVCRSVETWLRSQGLDVRRLQGPHGEPLGLYAEVGGRRGPGRWTVLDAPLDTAGFGAPGTWARPPTSAFVADGWLHGRGSADSKAAVALFAHLLAELQAAPAFAGRIGALFDADEHSGRFGGARAFFGSARPDGVLIGYPGPERIVTGGRGFLRATLTVHGVGAHPGSASRRGVNAIERALDLAAALRALPLPAADASFGLPPALTLTGIEGGDGGFSLVPDRCTLRVDLRLTPGFDADTARRRVLQAVTALDASRGAAAPTAVDWEPGWPAFQTPPAHPLAQALAAAAADEFGHAPPFAVVGPSNIGNYLATLGVPAIAGFGVRCEGIHAADERIALDTIGPVYRVYRSALLRLHAG